MLLRAEIDHVSKGPRVLDSLPFDATCRPDVVGMSYKKLYEQIRLGLGQGHGRYYQPWLQIRRKNPSPCSNQVVAWLPPLQRVAHFFSRGEYHTALLLLWLAVLDLREQYPIWPIAHPHPLTGAEGASQLKLAWSRGLLQIAQKAGIDHGYEIGSRRPYIATMDLVATVKSKNELKLFAFSSKPINDADQEVKWRTLERLELERRYTDEIRALYLVSSSSLVPTLMAGNLEWWLDCSTLHFQPSMLLLANRFSDCVNKRTDLSLSESIHYAAKTIGIPLDTAWLLFRHCAWTQKIDIDPSWPVIATYPIRAGGRELRASVRRQLFEEA
jgi:hypothetical protein